MSDKNEKKILDEIRKRVLEREEALNKKKEIEANSEATKEALAEMTSLSRSEVDNIAKQVREERERSNAKKNKVIIAAFVIACIFLYQYIHVSDSNTTDKEEITSEEVIDDDIIEENKFELIEEFDDNNNGWDIFESDYNRFIESGSYIFEVNVDDWCYWDKVALDFPFKYTIEVKSTWNKGKFDEYGIMLFQDDDNYKVFQLNGDGSSSVASHINDKWAENTKWIEKTALAGNNKNNNIQRVSIVGNEYSYYVNGKLIRKGNLNNLKIENMCLRVCDEQMVSFKEVTITNDTNNSILFHDDFTKGNSKWNQKKSYKKESYFENGKFYFRTNKEDHCYWADCKTSFFKNTEVELTSIWQEGEQSNFGLMIMQDNDNYLTCEYMNDGSARLVKCANDVYTEKPTYKKTGTEANGTTSIKHKVLIKGQKISYYINNIFVGSSTLDDMQLSRIGLRVCGHQTVAFDRLTVKKMK